MTLPTKKIGKSMIIAIAVIVILVIAFGAVLVNSLNSPISVASPTPTPNPTTSPTTNAVPYDFNISTNIPSFNLTQGHSLIDTITLTTVSGNASSVNPQDVIWSADSGSSGIHFDFKTSFSYENDYFARVFPDLFIPNGFSCVLSITVPSSTPTDNYNITITAKIGANSHSISILVSVPSALVTVSGTVDASILGITPSQIAFLDQGDPNTNHYNVTLTGNTYSISVPNNRGYFVMVSESNGYESNGKWYNWINCDSYSVGVPAGSTSMTKDFTVPTEAIKSNPIITVSGTFKGGNSGITGSQLKFQNLAAHSLIYYATLTENGTYSIDLPNYFNYCVYVDNGTAPNGAIRWNLVDTLFTVKVPAGSTSISQDFTVSGS